MENTLEDKYAKLLDRLWNIQLEYVNLMNDHLDLKKTYHDLITELNNKQ